MNWGIGGFGLLIWVLLLIFFGLRSLRRGHWVMFIIGLFIRLLWIIGALIPPTADARAAGQ